MVFKLFCHIAEALCVTRHVIFLQVSVIDMNGPTLLYQKQITSEISTGIISLQFQTCSLQGFKKNVLAVGTKDSSVLALDSETGNQMSTETVHPKKQSRALLMQVLGKSFVKVDTMIDHRKLSEEQD